MSEVASVLHVVVLGACVGSGMMAGLFATFSGFMMRSLGSLPPAEGIRAMQAINRDIVRPGFLLVFLGTGALALAAAVLTWGTPTAGVLSAVAAAVYLVGAVGTTMAFNVPLNDRLEAVDADTPDGQALWARYLVTWTRWNHVRSVASLVAAVLLCLVALGL